MPESLLPPEKMPPLPEVDAGVHPPVVGDLLELAHPAGVEGLHGELFPQVCECVS